MVQTIEMNQFRKLFNLNRFFVFFSAEPIVFSCWSTNCENTVSPRRLYWSGCSYAGVCSPLCSPFQICLIHKLVRGYWCLKIEIVCLLLFILLSNTLGVKLKVTIGSRSHQYNDMQIRCENILIFKLV